MKTILWKLALIGLISSVPAISAEAGSAKLPAGDPQPAKVGKGYVRQAENGWVYVHLEGTPAELGYQHGYLLAAAIEDAQRVVLTDLTHNASRPASFFRQAAELVFLPRIEEQYLIELQGMVKGLHERGSKLDLVDLIVMNAYMELTPYYTSWYARQHPGEGAPKPPTPERCSAFVATGRYTKDGRPVIAHNNWSSYSEGERWNYIFDIKPATGERFLMDGMPGLIHSGDDFGINTAGMMITETTISTFNGFDPAGIPEFVRARKAMQYSRSIEEFVRIMSDGNNGGYANTWLLANRNTGEIASLELGLRSVTLNRTKDGFYVGSNFPSRKMAEAEIPSYNLDDDTFSANARRQRATDLLRKNKGKVDLEFAKAFLSDHVDPVTGKIDPNERTLCGHIDRSPRGVAGWEAPYGISGTVQAKVADAASAAELEFEASLGHPCGISFHAAEHLDKHPESAWQKDTLKDMPSRPWTRIGAAR